MLTTLNAVTVLAAIGLAGLGLAFGFARTLRFFTGGIFGFVLSVLFCATFGGMIAGIPAVSSWLARVNGAMADVWSFLGKLHLEKILYYVVLFFAVQLVRILLVKAIAGIFSLSNPAVRAANRVLGMVLTVAAVFLLVLLFFGVLKIFEATSFAQDILAKIEGSFLGMLYENNPVKFVEDAAETAVSARI